MPRRALLPVLLDRSSISRSDFQRKWRLVGTLAEGNRDVSHLQRLGAEFGVILVPPNGVTPLEKGL